MRLIGTQTGPSPRDRGFLCLDAQIEIESKGHVLHYWFDLPADLAPDLSPLGNPWAILMLPLACYFGEALTISLPVDRVLLDNLKGVQRLWASWYPDISMVPIEATHVIATDRRQSTPSPLKKTISCFSGGVDSLFTLFRHKDEVLGDGHSLIDDLLCVGGFNTSMSDFDVMCGELAPVAAIFDRRLVPILTNIRYGAHEIETPYSIGPRMEHLAHGALLASFIHMLAGRYKEFLIPASLDYNQLISWGSHPLLDPLFSASDLTVVHDGTSFTRLERVERVAQSQEALGVLHVCWQDRREGNCSQCEKCLRTMAALDLCGAKDQARTFDWSAYSAKRLATVRLKEPSLFKLYGEMAAVALERGRSEIAMALRASVRVSQRRLALATLVKSTLVSRAAWRAVRGLKAVVKGRTERQPAAPQRSEIEQTASYNFHKGR